MNIYFSDQQSQYSDWVSDAAVTGLLHVHKSVMRNYSDALIFWQRKQRLQQVNSQSSGTARTKLSVDENSTWVPVKKPLKTKKRLQKLAGSQSDEENSQSQESDPTADPNEQQEAQSSSARTNEIDSSRKQTQKSGREQNSDTQRQGDSRQSLVKTASRQRRANSHQNLHKVASNTRSSSALQDSQNQAAMTDRSGNERTGNSKEYGKKSKLRAPFQFSRAIQDPGERQQRAQSIPKWSVVNDHSVIRAKTTRRSRRTKDTANSQKVELLNDSKNLQSETKNPPPKWESKFKDKVDFYKTEDKESENLRKKFIQDMVQSRKQVQEKRLQEQQKIQTQIQNLQDAEVEQEKQKQAEIEKQKQIRLAKSQEKLQERKKAREDLAKETAASLGRAKSNYPLFQEIEDRFMANSIIPHLEQKKKELAEKRELRTVSKSELDLHQKQYLQSKSSAELRRQKELKQRNFESKAMENVPSYYRSLSKNNAHETDRVFQSFDAQDLEQRKKKHTIRRKYADMVQELYRPIPDPNKKIEFTLDRYNKRIKPVHSAEKHQHRHSESSPKILIKKRKYKPNSMIIPDKPRPEPKITDYLGQLRQKRQEIFENNDFNVNYQPTKQFQDVELSSEEQIFKARQKIDKMEKQAEMTEFKANQLNPMALAGLQAQATVSSMYLDSLKAKIQILKHI